MFNLTTRSTIPAAVRLAAGPGPVRVGRPVFTRRRLVAQVHVHAGFCRRVRLRRHLLVAVFVRRPRRHGRPRSVPYAHARTRGRDLPVPVLDRYGHIVTYLYLINIRSIKSGRYLAFKT